MEWAMYLQKDMDFLIRSVLKLVEMSWVEKRVK